MRFLVDRCIGLRLSDWLRESGHDSIYTPALGPDPGDEILLRWAREQGRVLITIDKDFGALVFVRDQPHAGIIRMPDVAVQRRIDLLKMVLENHGEALEAGAIITIRGERIRVSQDARE